MSTFDDFIAESFHSEVNLSWRLESETRAVATFDIGDLSVEVLFEQREERGPWHVAFNVVRSGDLPHRPHLAFRIFNGVFQAVHEFIETREPAIVVFISKDDDLAGIYETYLRREKAAIEELGYTIEGPDRVDPYTQFTLRRVRPSAWIEAQ